MERRIFVIFILIIMIFGGSSFPQKNILLPKPRRRGKYTLEEVLERRRSGRKFLPHSLDLQEVSNILWAGYGKNRYRYTAPSAGALYPLFIYLVAGNIEDLEKGVYLYDRVNHSLKVISSQDIRAKLAQAALSQHFIREAPLVIIICANFNITTSKYGERGLRYVYMEVGYVSENIYLMVNSLDLATVAVGAFYDEEVKRLLGIVEEPLLIMPVGRPSP